MKNIKWWPNKHSFSNYRKKLEQDAEKRLEQKNKILDFALQSGKMGTWDFNLSTNQIFCSTEMLELWGIPRDEFHNRREALQAKVHPDDLDKMLAAIQNAIDHDAIYELEYRILPSPGNQLWVKSRGRCSFPANSSVPNRFAGVVYDITEAKKKEEDLANALKTRDQFFMIASHELKTPLTCLDLQIQVNQWDLKNKYPSAFSVEKIEAGLKKQKEHLHRITRIIDNILDVSKISEGRFHLEMEVFDLADMIEETLQRFEVTIKSSKSDVIFKNKESITGKWDRYRLEQVFLNLLINAIRYGRQEPIHIEVKKNANYAFLVVRDHGVGIKEKDQERIFERFERATSDFTKSGMGLGLYISKRIVEAHQGKIHVESEQDKGSEFIVALPFLSI